ncbi:MAG: polysaccharide biosynthesis protein [Mailhella sp.]|nr:polysaccharide biosynthesis protein [Mailhella sp.]
MPGYTLQKIFELRRSTKVAISLLADGLSVCLAFLGAYLNYYNFEPAMFYAIPLENLLLIVPVTLLLFFAAGLYKNIVRYLSPSAIFPICGVSLVSGMLLYALELPVHADTAVGLPLVYILLSGFLCSAARFTVQSLYMNTPGRNIRSAIVYGAGESGRQLVSMLNTGDKYHPVAFVDDDPELQGRSILGIRVHPRSDIPRLLARYRVGIILLSIPRLKRSERKHIIDDLAGYGTKVLSVPGIDDLIGERASVADLRPVPVEDLLGRDPVEPITGLLDKDIRGKTILVTGAGGSIGSELCRQSLRNGARQVVLFEISEIALYNIAKELNALPEGRGRIVPLLGDVRDKAELVRVMKRFGVQTVYHAAAYKHVPLVEYNAVQGAQNNIFGTLSAAEAAVEAGAENFLAISTDKAVRPTNIMGATKRMAEIIVQTIAEEHPETDLCLVRFGNVLGSSGSVIPLFRSQIEKGGPVTVTHPDITRYFMTIPEAVQLVIQAGAMGSRGDVFVLDMGKPVKILDLARKMITLTGLTVRDEQNPDGDIEILFTGLRPGEKLYEELLIEGRFEQTPHSRIMRKHEPRMSAQTLRSHLARIRAACDAEDADALAKLFIIPEICYQPKEINADLRLARRQEEDLPEIVI